MESVILFSKNKDPHEMIRDYETKNCSISLSGALSTFVGYMRKTNSTREDIVSMTLEFYPAMTKPYLEKLILKVKKKYKVDNVFIAHRVGEVCVKDCLVVIACWAKHRKQSIGAVEYILEELKHNAPLWKKEFYKDNTSRWVENNT